MSTIRPDMPPAVRQFLDHAVSAERQHQAEKGYDRDHDDEHGPDQLNQWAERYAAQGGYVAALALLRAAAEARHRRAQAADLARYREGLTAKAGDS